MAFGGAMLPVCRQEFRDSQEEDFVLNTKNCFWLSSARLKKPVINHSKGNVN